MYFQLYFISTLYIYLNLPCPLKKLDLISIIKFIIYNCQNNLAIYRVVLSN